MQYRAGVGLQRRNGRPSRSGRLSSRVPLAQLVLWLGLVRSDDRLPTPPGGIHCAQESSSRTLTQTCDSPISAETCTSNCPGCFPCAMRMWNEMDWQGFVKDGCPSTIKHKIFHGVPPITVMGFRVETDSGDKLVYAELRDKNDRFAWYQINVSSDASEFVGPMRVDCDAVGNPGATADLTDYRSQYQAKNLEIVRQQGRIEDLETQIGKTRYQLQEEKGDDNRVYVLSAALRQQQDELAAAVSLKVDLQNNLNSLGRTANGLEQQVLQGQGHQCPDSKYVFVSWNKKSANEKKHAPALLTRAMSRRLVMVHRGGDRGSETPFKGYRNVELQGNTPSENPLFAA